MQFYYRGLPVVIVSSGLWLAACEQSPHATSSGDADTGSARKQVLACYAAAYQEREQRAASLDERDAKAAEELLARYAAQTRRACDAVAKEMSRALCGLPVALASVVICDQRRREAKAGSLLDTTTKYRLDKRAHEEERNSLTPGGGAN